MDIQDIVKSVNIAEDLTDEQLSTIGSNCYSDYQADLVSRRPWELKMTEAMKLALQLAEKKNTPWQGASNVLFPILSISTINFQARVFAQLFATPRPVRMRVIGKDPQSEKHNRAARISEHMSYQVLEEDEEWLSEHDTMLMVLPIMGCGFIKTYHDEYCRGVNVHPKDLVVNYYAKSLETASRYTHVIPMYKNEIIEKQRDEIYKTMDITPIEHQRSEFDQVKDKSQGTNPPPDKDAPIDVYEQYCYLDLDDDGYEEPYTVTFDAKGRVYRIINRFKDITYKNDIIQKITAKHYFTKYTFIPSPDGGFYDYGFGHLLSPINHSVNTIINQLIDAGTLANRQGGFIGRGARLKGGKIRYKMGEFIPINSTGDDIRKNVFQMPFKEPSQVLFTLLTYLVEYGERLSAVSDMMVGKTPGQNTPATTAMAALEEGMRVFTSIYQRVYRGLKKEFQKRYLLNQEYLDPEEYFETEDDVKAILQQDYMGDPKDVRPTADPMMSSDLQRLQRLDALSQRAMSVQGYNLPALELRRLEVMNTEGIDEIYPTDDKGQPVIQPTPDPKIEIESTKFQAEQIFKSQQLQIEKAKVESLIGVQETQALLNLAKAEQLGNKTEIEAYKALLEKLKVERDGIRGIQSETGGRGLSAMEDRSGNEGDNEVSE